MTLSYLSYSLKYESLINLISFLNLEETCVGSVSFCCIRLTGIKK